MSQPLPVERRQHVMYVTRHTEYHCRDRECVGVRDRASGRWQRRHGALRARLAGSVSSENRFCEQVRAGRRLVFVGDASLLTSRVESAHRPPKWVIWSYANLCKAGVIER